jgi:hypothetical protein
MPPEKSSRSVLFKNWIKAISAEDVYSIDGTIIFCQACQKNVKALEDAPGQIGVVLREKYRYVVVNNPDISTISKIGKVLDGENVPNFTMSPNLLAHYKYAPLTSCDVERSFSRYKSILTDNRTSFLPQNLEKHLICACENVDSDGDIE